VARPAPIDLNDLIGKMSPEFTDLELYLADGVANSLVTTFGLDADTLQVVVILDQEAVARITGNQVVLSFSGRVYPPTVDANGQPLVDPDFKTPIIDFFQKESIEFKFADTQLMSFTCLVPAIDVNERAPEEPKDDEDHQEGKKEGAEGDDGAEADGGEPADESDGTEPREGEGDGQTNVDDFLDSLETDTAEKPEEKPEEAASEPAKPEETEK